MSKTPLFSSPFARITGPLDEVTRVAEEGEPDLAGMNDADIAAIWKATEGWYRTATQPFVSLCIRRRGQTVLHRSLGHSHGDWSRAGIANNERAVVGPVETPVCAFSASKALTAMLIHGLAEDGLLDLDQTVAHYLPQFAVHGKERITISDVLTHGAGMPRLPENLPPETMFDYDGVVDLVLSNPPQYRPGSTTAYHAISGGYVLSALSDKVTGRSLNQLLRKRIVLPLGLSSLRYGATLNQQAKVATNYNTGHDLPRPLSAVVEKALASDWNSVVATSNEAGFLNTIVPAGNVIGNAHDWCVLMELMRNGGEFNEQRVFKEATVQRALQVKRRTLFDRTLCMPMQYSEGFMCGATPASIFGPMTASAFGHLGFINIFCWADPQRHTSVALMSTGKSLIGAHLAELGRLIWVINSRTRR